MPTYDYVCDHCGDKFEHFQSMSSEPLKRCTKCKRKKLRRLIGAGAGLVFKGSGFYITDYRSESYKQRAEADRKSSNGSANGSSSGQTSSKGESKAASGD